MTRTQLDYWLAHTALREIADRRCTDDQDTCPHCTARACLDLIHEPLDPPPAFLEGLEHAGERVCSATGATFTRLATAETST